MKLGLIALAFLIVAPLPRRALADELPFTLVSCDMNGPCDYDVQKIEKFVADFYRWYLPILTNQSSPLENPANRSIIDAALSKNAFKRYYFSDYTHDLLTDSTHILPSWSEPDQTLALSFQPSPYHGTVVLTIGKGTEKRSLAVVLQVDRNAWRIRYVQDMAWLPFSPILCKSAESCDRDPAHFQKFLLNFYNWQMLEDTNLNDWDAEPGQHILKTAFTKQFFDNLQKLCDSTDENPIEHGMDFGKAAKDDIILSDIYFYAQDASADIIIGKTLRYPMKFRIGFKVENGQWKIDSIIRTEPL